MRFRYYAYIDLSRVDVRLSYHNGHSAADDGLEVTDLNNVGSVNGFGGVGPQIHEQIRSFHPINYYTPEWESYIKTKIFEQKNSFYLGLLPNDTIVRFFEIPFNILQPSNSYLIFSVISYRTLQDELFGRFF